MPVPTLLTKGNIDEERWMTKEEKSSIKDTIAVNYVVDFLNRRRPSNPQDQSYGTRATNTPGGKIILLESGTGSGKSTVLPPEVYKNRPQRIAVTQPRVLTAKSIPQEIAFYNEEFRIRENLGWSTGSNKCLPVNKRNLTYMTTGSLSLRVQLNPMSLFAFGTVFIDEVHDRTLDADSLHAMIKQFLAEHYDNPRCPLIVLMSATFDRQELADYYGVPDRNWLRVTGQTFPIELHWSVNAPEDYVNYAVHVCGQLDAHESSTDKSSKEDVDRPKDVLIFVPGESIAKQIIKGIDALNSERLKSGDERFFLPISLNSRNYKAGGRNFNLLTMPIYRLQVDVNTTSNEPKKSVTPYRKVIVTTNVAETGVTIHGLGYVIETGKVYTSMYDPLSNSEILMEAVVTQAESRQRRGRVGRIAAGDAFFCYTEKTFNSLLKNPIQEILKGDITFNLLKTIIRLTECTMTTKSDHPGDGMYSSAADSRDRMVVGRPFTLDQLDYITWPSIDAIGAAVRKLQQLGYLDSRMHPTVLGMSTASLGSKLTPEGIRTIQASYAWGVDVMDVITVLSMLSLRLQFSKSDYENRFGALGVLLSLWDNYCTAAGQGFRSLQKFCDRRRMTVHDWYPAIEARLEIITALKEAGYPIDTSSKRHGTRKFGDFNNLRSVFLDGFKTQLAHRIGNGSYLYNGIPVVMPWQMDREFVVCLSMITRAKNGQYATTVDLAA